MTKDVPLLQRKSYLFIFFTALLFLHVLIEFLLGMGQFSKADFQRGDFFGESFSWVAFLRGGEYSGEHFDWIEKKRLKIPQTIVLLGNNTTKMLDF